MIDCNEWRTEKWHECANMGKVKRLELWWQLYRTSLPVWDLENFRPMDFCWHECTVRMKVAGFHKMLVPVNDTKHHQIPEVHNLNIQCHENIKSHQHTNEVTQLSHHLFCLRISLIQVWRNQTCLPIPNNIIWMQRCSKFSISPFLWNPFKFEEQLTVC